jgi:hypothetical protein
MDQKAYGIIPPDCCLVRLRLDEAEQWVIRQPQCAPAPTEATRAFVTESRKAETLARARRVRNRVGRAGVDADRWRSRLVAASLAQGTISMAVGDWGRLF